MSSILEPMKDKLIGKVKKNNGEINSENFQTEPHSLWQINLLKSKHTHIIMLTNTHKHIHTVSLCVSLLLSLSTHTCTHTHTPAHTQRNICLLSILLAAQRQGISGRYSRSSFNQFGKFLYVTFRVVSKACTLKTKLMRQEINANHNTTIWFQPKSEGLWLPIFTCNPCVFRGRTSWKDLHFSLFNYCFKRCCLIFHHLDAV